MQVLSSGKSPGESDVPETFRTALHAPYPNPCNPMTHIEFTLERPMHIKLAIYNVRGEKVRDLFSGFTAAGPHVVDWNGRGDRGQALSSGLYFARMKAGAHEETQRLMLVR
jgi:flagellar hook assembly protein FlgD